MTLPALVLRGIGWIFSCAFVSTTWAQSSCEKVLSEWNSPITQRLNQHPEVQITEHDTGFAITRNHHTIEVKKADYTLYTPSGPINKKLTVISDFFLFEHTLFLATNVGVLRIGLEHRTRWFRTPQPIFATTLVMAPTIKTQSEAPWHGALKFETLKNEEGPTLLKVTWTNPQLSNHRPHQRLTKERLFDPFSAREVEALKAPRYYRDPWGDLWQQISTWTGTVYYHNLSNPRLNDPHIGLLGGQRAIPIEILPGQGAPGAVGSTPWRARMSDGEVLPPNELGRNTYEARQSDQLLTIEVAPPVL